MPIYFYSPKSHCEVKLLNTMQLFKNTAKIKCRKPQTAHYFYVKGRAYINLKYICNRAKRVLPLDDDALQLF